ncbi:uncharacterized protein LOC134262116 [Saccostrea cucullata]|uniref:uncharacterized protein LOC134262116 n=1 Tax=Saccostrea cuccullata TaxID=36930 RepID=UPI002ED08352
MAVIPHAQTRYLRAVNATVVVIPKAIRKFFLTKHQITTLTKDLSDKEEEIKKYPGVTKGNLHLLLPGKGKLVNPEEFDITLLTTLLRNFTKISPPSTGWNNAPFATDTSEGADLVRIRLIRNQLMHKNDGELDEQEFKSIWSEIKNAVSRLGKGAFDLEITSLLISSIDGSQKDILTHFKKQVCQIEKIETEVDNIKFCQNAIKKRIGALEEDIRNNDMLIQLQSRPNNYFSDSISDTFLWDIDEQIKCWKSENETFHVTKFAENLYNAISLNNIVTVVGNSGSGKTATTRYVALKLKEEGYKIIPVNRPEDIQRYHNKNKKQIFVVDDVVGDKTLDEHLSNSWERKSFIEWAKRNHVMSIEGNAENIKRNLTEDIRKDQIKIDKDSKSCKILVTCRSIISNSRRFKRIKILCLNILNIDFATNKISYLERKEILQKYTNLHLNITEVDFMRHDNFPLLCKIFSKNDSLHSAPEAFFLNPFSEYIKELENLFVHNNFKYCTLVCLLLFGNKFVTEENENISGIQDVFKSFGILFQCSRVIIRNALEELTDVYVRRISESYEFLHATHTDIIAYHLCITQKNFWLMAKYGPVSIIRDRVRPYKTLNSDDHRDEYFIIIEGSDVDLLIRRIYKEITEPMNWEDIFHLPYFPNDCLEEKLGKTIIKESPMLFLSAKTDCIFSSVYWGNLSELRHIFLLKCPLLLWTLGFGWAKLFDLGLKYQYSEYAALKGLLLNRDVCYVLSLMSSNTKLVKKIDSLCKVQSSCLLCENYSAKPTFEHSENCPVNFISDIYVPCVSGSEDVMNYFLSKSPHICVNVTHPLPNFELITRSCYVTPLQVSCMFGFYDITNLLLKANADVEASVSNTDSPLLFASRRGFSEVVALLISKGASINKYKGKKPGPLMAAIYSGSKEVVHVLLSSGISVNDADIRGDTPLHAASKANQESIAKILIESKADMDISNNSGNTPLLIACCEGNEEIISLLLRSGASHTAHLNCMPLLYFAIHYGFKDIVLKLLSRGALSTYCSTPYLHKAVYKQDIEIIEILLEKKSVVNIVDSYENTPLHESCRVSSDEKIVKCLLSYGADTNLKNREGETALIISGKYGCSKSIPLLLEKGAKLNQEDKSGRTALWWSCVNGNLESTRILLKRNADVNKQDVAGCSPLFWACSNGYINTVKELLSFGAKIIATKESITPFWAACSSGKIEVVSLLFKKGIDPTLCNNRNESPLWIACKNGHSMVVSFLLENSAYSDKEIHERSPLRMACILRKRNVIEILLRFGFGIGDFEYALARTTEKIKRKINFSSLMDFFLNGVERQFLSTKLQLQIFEDCFGNLDKKDIYGNTPLLVASRNGFSNIVFLLLSQGANPNYENPNDGMTALMWSRLKKHDDITLMLMGYDSKLVTTDSLSKLFSEKIKHCSEVVPVAFQNKLVEEIDSGTNCKFTRPIFIALREGYEEVLRILHVSQFEVDVNVSNKNGDTALIICCKYYQVKMIKLLLENRAEIDQRDGCGRTALWWACVNGDMKVASLLLEKNADNLDLMADHSNCRKYLRIRIELELFSVW